MSKPERSLSDEVKQAIAELPTGCPSKTRMRKIINAFIKSREISAQEVYHNIMGYPYVRKSRKVIYIPTGWRKDRHRLLKSKKEREKLDPTSTDVFWDNIIDRYEKRRCCVASANPRKPAEPSERVPGCRCSQERKDSIANIPLCLFVASYELPQPKGGVRKWDAEREEGSEESEPEEGTADGGGEGEGEGIEQQQPDYDEGRFVEEEDDEGEEEHLDVEALEGLPDDVYLLGRKPPMRKRRKKAIIRYHRYNTETDAEQFSYTQLLLFLPFWKERENLDLVNNDKESYKQWLEDERERIQQIAVDFESFSELIAVAFEEMDKDRLAEKMAQDLDDAEDGEDEGEEDAEKRAVLDFLAPDDFFVEENIFDGLDPPENEGGPVGDTGPNPGMQYNNKQEILAELEQMKKMMNQGQTDAFQTACSYMQSFKESEGKSFTERPIFLSGAGGTRNIYSIGPFLISAPKFRLWQVVCDQSNPTGASSSIPQGLDGDFVLEVEPQVSRLGTWESLRI